MPCFDGSLVAGSGARRKRRERPDSRNRRVRPTRCGAKRSTGSDARVWPAKARPAGASRGRKVKRANPRLNQNADRSIMRSGVRQTARRRSAAGRTGGPGEIIATLETDTRASQASGALDGRRGRSARSPGGDSGSRSRLETRSHRRKPGIARIAGPAPREPSPREAIRRGDPGGSGAKGRVAPRAPGTGRRGREDHRTRASSGTRQRGRDGDLDDRGDRLTPSPPADAAGLMDGDGYRSS